MFTVLIVDPIAEEGINLLLENSLEVRYLEERSHHSIKNGVTDVDALIVRTSKITREVIENAPQLKVIARHGVGYDNIDLQAATEQGIVVTNTPTANVVAVSEHIIGVMIMLFKHIRRADIDLRKGKFEVRNLYIGTELEGKTLGIIGLGRIGRRVGTIAAKGLGMNVIGYDPYILPDALDADITLIDSWEEIFARPDVVSVNLPLTTSTVGIIGEEELSLMKPSAIFLNYSRGSIVKEDALVRVLEAGKILGAGLDVFEQEPTPADNPLLQMEQVVVTPHMAAHSKEAMVKMATHAAQGVVEVLSGNKATWQVNK